METTPAKFVNFPQLQAEAFGNWLFRVQCILEERGLKDIIEAKKIDEGNTNLDAKARSIIVQCLTDRHLNLVKDCCTAKEMLNSLKSTFQRKSVISKISLRRKLLTLKQDGSLEEYFAKFENIIRELEVSDEKITESDKVCYLLTGLGDEYNHVITAIETVNAELSLEFVRAKLLDHEVRKSQESNDKNETSFSSRNTQDVICYKCKKKGHKSYECRTSSRGRGKGFRGPRSRDGAAHSAQKNIFLASEQALIAKDMDNTISFIVDSGATQHFIQEKYIKYMTDVENLPQKLNIKIANGQTLTATQRGILEAYYNNNEIIQIYAVIVPGLSTNLLSVNKLVERGKRVIFKRDKLLITENKKIYFGEKKNMLYTFTIKIKNNEACNMTREDKDIWHKRMGHMCRKNLAILGLPYSKEVCEACMRSKSTRLPFKRLERPRSHQVGDLIHTDISGPARQATKEGYKYFQTITDDYSHFTQTYLLKNKYEATGKLIKYVIEQERQEGIKVKRIRCDNGGEFTAKSLRNFCDDKGIKIEYTQPYSPQQNGKAERMNRTIYDKARTMLDESNLPRHLWGQAILTATFLINRSPCSSISYKVPARIRNKEFKFNKIKIFGCKAWAHIMPRQDKLSNRAIPARMVGYSMNGYTLWNPETDEIFVSRDVRFDETNIKYETEEDNRNVVRIEASQENKEKCEETKDKEPKHVEIEEDDFYDLEECDSPEKQKSEITRTRSGREIKKPKQFNLNTYEEYCLLSSENDPTTYTEAINQGEEWKMAIDKEVKSLEELNTWTESELPKGKSAIDTKWIFRTKSDGTKKARLVARGFQQYTEDYVYSPVANITTIRMGLSEVINNNWETKQIDIPTAFLNGNLQTEVYIKVPEGVSLESNRKGTVLKLQKALYGLKESPKCWNTRFDTFCNKINMKRSKHDICLYIGQNIWLILFVDDILLMGNKCEINKISSLLKEEFNAKDMGKVSNYLGIEIRKTENTLKLSQKKFIKNILKKYNMLDCKELKTPMENNFSVPETEEIISNVPYRELIGSLTYLSTISRPDITFATSFLSRYLDKPTRSLWIAAKRVLRYLKGTMDKELTYRCQKKENINNFSNISAFSDADWASDKTTRKSVSGALIYHQGNLISWSSKKQRTVSLSSAESEYIAAASCVSDLLFVKGLSIDFNDKCSIVLYVDNQSAIKMIHNCENTKHSKHIDIKYHFIKDTVNKNILSVKYVSTSENISDIMTKPLCNVKFCYFRDKLLIL